MDKLVFFQNMTLALLVSRYKNCYLCYEDENIRNDISDISV